tara:strand:- start:2272 stop:3303 length:1032 start_codon:yes stop_codon:yes gene_type:complete
MATSNASGRLYNAIVGIQQTGVLAIGGDGDIADGDFLASGNYFMRMASVNPINYDGSFQTATVLKTGRRTYEDGDYIQQYGNGIWTWDFDYIVENKILLESLLTLVTEVADTTGTITITPAHANAKRDYAHGVDTPDLCGIVVLEADTVGGLSDHDHCMHSAILQNLTLSYDADVDGGRLHAAGQFMSGYKPIVGNHGVTGVATASDYEKTIFSLATRTIGSHTVKTMKSFSITITNPASRVGWQGTSGETDGYSRGALFDISGTMTLKYDDEMADALADWQAGTAYAIVVEQSNTSYNIPSARMTGHNIDMADDGMFVEIPWTATTGAAGTGNLAVIKAFAA